MDRIRGRPAEMSLRPRRKVGKVIPLEAASPSVPIKISRIWGMMIERDAEGRPAERRALICHSEEEDTLIDIAGEGK